MANDAPAVSYRTLLEQERAQLLEQLAELGFDDPGKISYDRNFADSSQVTAERGEAEALAAPLRETLAEVERALRKIADGTYGRCERCGKEISPARLEAMPAARFCLECSAAARR
jgi:DnaK suppressor protein